MTSRSLLLLLVVAITSCAHRGGAAGNDASVSGTWTIEGAPPTAASCAEVNIDIVRLGIYGAGGTEYIDRLEAPCIAGRIDTGTPVLAAGTYDIAWEGFRGGVRVAQGTRHQLIAVQGGHSIIPVVDFVSGYDPRGTDASVSAHWTINGVAPSASACTALGIGRVRVAVFHGTRAIELPQLASACATGAIDTGTMAVLAAGDVVVQLQALDAHDVVLFSGAMAMDHIARGPTHLALYGDTPVDFASSSFDPHGADATVAFRWTLDHAIPSIDVCDSVGVTTVHLVLYAPDDSARAHGVSIAQAPCNLGSFDSGTSAVLRAGAYVASIEGRGADGAVLAAASPSTTPFAVTARSHFDVPSVDLSFPTTLTITLDWRDPVTGSAANCIVAGVTSMGYTLTNRTSGIIVEQRGVVTCTQRLVFDPTRTPGFGAGRYDLAITGTSATHTWHTASPECTSIDVAAGSIAWDACLATNP